MAVLVMIAVLKRKKGKSGQYRFLKEYRRELKDWLGSNRFPSRSTYFKRHRRGYQLFQQAIRWQGQLALEEGVTDTTDVAVDKSLIAARGPLWHASDRKRNRIPQDLHGIDQDSDWGCSRHDG